MTFAVVTTVSRNYLPLAHVLMDSVARFHPESKRFVLLIDGEDGNPDPAIDAEILLPSLLVGDAREQRVLEGIYQPIEYATALKPKLLLHALGVADTAFFIDPDMRLFAPMTGALAAIEEGASVLLTPHRVTPPDEEHKVLFEWVSKAYGTYNTTFVGVTAAAIPFLRWWDARLRRDCIADIDAMEWVDQRIVDLAPGYFPVAVLRDPAYNVAWWNLVERVLHEEDGVWWAGGTPLVLMHYSGVQSKELLSVGESAGLPQLVHSPKNPVVQDEVHLAAIRRLEAEYIRDLRAVDHDRLSRLPYGFASTPGGRRLSPADRRLYRSVVLAAEARGAQPPLPDEISWSAPRRLKHAAYSAYSLRGAARDARALRDEVRKRRARRAAR